MHCKLRISDLPISHSCKYPVTHPQPPTLPLLPRLLTLQLPRLAQQLPPQYLQIRHLSLPPLPLLLSLARPLPHLHPLIKAHLPLKPILLHLFLARTLVLQAELRH